jgi:archaellum component FlaC
LNDAITNIHERLNQLSDGLGGEIDCLPEKIQEIKRYITVLDWNIK